MKAAVFYGKEKGLVIEEYPTPEFSEDDVLVKVAACGVCHTDLHYIDHGVPTFKKPPLILGHECSGTIEEVGAKVKNFNKGDRVLLPAVLTCGVCENCRLGKENVCENMQMFGNSRNGAYAEFVSAPAKDVFHLPEEIPLQEGSIIADAVSTPYHAVKNRAKVRPGDTVVIFGCGGVGMNVVQLAAASGASVIAVDISDSKLEYAKSFGAAYVINAEKVEKVDKEVRRITGSSGADIAIEAIGNPKTIEIAFKCVKTGGRLCVIGYTEKTVTLNAARLMFREMEIVGSLGCRPVDYPKIIEMARLGSIKVKEMVTAKFPLDKIEDAFDYLRNKEGLRALIVF